MRSILGLTCLLTLVLTLTACATSGPAQTQPSSQWNTDRLVVVAVDNPPLSMMRQPGSTPRSYGMGGAYRTSSSALRQMRALMRKHGLREVAAWPIDVLGVHCSVLEPEAGRSREEVLAALSADPRVKLAQPLQLFASQGEHAGHAYDDPYAGLQSDLKLMGVEQAHRWSTGNGVRVAIVDTGLDVTHPDLERSVVAREDFVRGDFEGFNQDIHGTAVAGIIAAGANNSVGIVGIAPGAEILALKACWQVTSAAGEGKTVSAVCNSFTLARAIASAIRRDAHIINLSLAGPADPLLERLLESAMQRDMIVIGAVDDGTAGEFPASVRGVIAVQSAESETSIGMDQLLYAPGSEVLTLRPAGHYDFESGSSMATASVAGVAALLRESRPQLDSRKTGALLAASSQAVTLASGKDRRVINACAALAALADQVPCQSPAAIVVSTAADTAASSAP